jgi:hypothetical protein
MQTEALTADQSFDTCLLSFGKTQESPIMAIDEVISRMKS